MTGSKHRSFFAQLSDKRQYLSKQWILPIVCLIVGVVGGWAIAGSGEKEISARIRPLRAATSTFEFIDPLIGFDVAGRKEFQEYHALETKIRSLINGKLAERKADNVSVYFRDVENGHWAGIDENREYEPASLFKVPIMIAYYRQAETDPNIFTKTILFTPTSPAATAANDGQPSQLVVNERYSAERLIQYMIVSSDNKAKDLLMADLNLNALNEVLSDLGVQFPHEGRVYGISAKTYSLFFRSLYNATILNREMSEKALGLLSKTTFTEGLRAGVPMNVTIAHKFGQRDSFENGTLVSEELHDCGIVYPPENPYFICVMTQGRDLGELKEVIRGISLLAYEEVAAAHKK